MCSRPGNVGLRRLSFQKLGQPCYLAYSFTARGGKHAVSLERGQGSPIARSRSSSRELELGGLIPRAPGSDKTTAVAVLVEALAWHATACVVLASQAQPRPGRGRGPRAWVALYGPWAASSFGTPLPPEPERARLPARRSPPSRRPDEGVPGCRPLPWLTANGLGEQERGRRMIRPF